MVVQSTHTHTPYPSTLRLMLPNCPPQNCRLNRYLSARTHTHTHTNTDFNFLSGYEKVCVNNAWWDRERNRKSREKQAGESG